jgi:hypothetical protein
MTITFRDILPNEQIRMEYLEGKGNPLIIELDGSVLGYIWYSILGIEMKIEMVEVIKKGKGNGDKIVDHIFNNMGIDVITGYAEKSQWDSAYYFWKRLGSNMLVDEEEFSSYYYGEQTYFELFKENVVLSKLEVG